MARTTVDTNANGDSDPEKSEPKKQKPKTNTMKIELRNSMNQKISITGSCTDKEIKAICKAFKRRDDQEISIT